MAKYENSLMMQSAQQNKDYLMQSLEMLNERRAQGDRTNFGYRNKDTAKQFSFFRFLTTKKDKTGRFGGATIADRKDSISAMDEGGKVPMGVYFDPLGLKMVKPRMVSLLDLGDEELTNAAVAEAEQIESDFVQRVDEQITLTRQNDFERDRGGLDARLALVEIEQKKKEITPESLQTVDELARNYNAGKAFEPDVYNDEIPDGFNVELAVDDPPPNFSQEWELFRAVNTKGIGARIKGVFRKIFGVHDPTGDELFKSFYTGLPEYKRLEEQGRREAKEVGKKYDPNKDTRLMSFVSEIGQINGARSNGHSGVRMNATKRGRVVSSYSFLFGIVNGAGMSGAITGAVFNPAEPTKNPVSATFPVSYANFLRAAAKIRGTAGSMRTYSFLGYNCSSFAAEVGLAAGINIKKEDTSEIMMTHRHRAQRVDSPYRLMKFINRTNQEREDEKAQNASYEEGRVDIDSPEARAERKLEIAYSKYLPMLQEHRVYKAVLDTGKIREESMRDNFREYLRRILIDSQRIDARHPIDGLEDERLEAAITARNNEKILSFGAKDLDGVMERFFTQGYALAIYNVVSGTTRFESDLSDLYNEQNRINKEGKKTGEKQPIKVNPEVDEAEFLRNMAEFDRQKREKTKAIGFEFAELEELEKAERPQIAVPQKVTQSLIKKMLLDLSSMNIDLEPFLTVFRNAVGIQGKNTSTVRPISSSVEIKDFLVRCNRHPDTKPLFPQAFADIMNAKTNIEQRNKYVELLRNIVSTLNENVLLQILADSYIM